MPEYLISLICVIAFAVAFYIVLRAVTPSSDMRIEIIIHADDGEEGTEKAVIAAKLLADRHFGNAEIYIRGGNPEYTEKLCAVHGIKKYTEMQKNGM